MMTGISLLSRIASLRPFPKAAATARAAALVSNAGTARWKADGAREITKPMIKSTTRSSMRVNPLQLPVCDLTVFALASFLAARPQRIEIIFAMLAGIAVDVYVAPGIVHLFGLLYVGPIPVSLVHRTFRQSLQAFLLRRIMAD